MILMGTSGALISSVEQVQGSMDEAFADDRVAQHSDNHHHASNFLWSLLESHGD